VGSVGGASTLNYSFEQKTIGDRLKAKNGSPGFMDRYEDGAMVVFTCIAGILTALLALFTFSKEWVTVKIPIFQSTYSFTLQDFSDVSKSLSGIMQYFDSGAASGLNIMATAASLSYWVLLLGAILSLVVSLVILASPKSEKLIAIPYIVIVAFAIIGLIFTAPMIFMSEYIAVSGLPITMLIVSGIPAVVLRLIG